MLKIPFDNGWYFKPGWADGTWSPSFLEGALPVSLPHDFTIYASPVPDSPEGVSTGYVNGGAGAYQKTFFAREDWRGKMVEFHLDGAYRMTEVWINGNRVGMHPNGYMPFSMNLTPYIDFDRENRLAVCANNSAPCSSRWYSGSGLYRHAFLSVSPMLRLATNPIYARTTALAEDKAELAIEIAVQNHADAKAQAHLDIRLTDDKTGETVARASADAFVPAHAEATLSAMLTLKNPKLWSVETPNLYQVCATLNEEDEDRAQFGVRMIEVDAENGLRINGKRVLLKGGCVHHTLGILGAAAFEDAEFKRVRAHKALGFNALRCAHNPPSADFLNACDRLGMMVIDEAFDMWRMPKKSNDYHLFFDAWWKEDMRLFMTRDRCHPSVIMWSTGNEVGERNGTSGGAALGKELVDFARSLDATRPIMNAIPTTFNALKDDDMKQMHAQWGKSVNAQNAGAPFAERAWAGLTEEFCKPLDVVGYNYLESRYERDHEQYPHRAMCGTESFPMNFDQIWPMVERLPFLIGDFTWTSMDYLGEAGLGRALYGEANEDLSKVKNAFPWRAANDADLDLCLQRRPQSHYRTIVWGSSETYIAVLPPKYADKTEWVSRWGWPEVYPEWAWEGFEGKETRVDVYSSAESVSLYLNGNLLGTRPAGRENRYIARFRATYAPGTLLAVSETNGIEISRMEIRTPGKPRALRMTADKTELRADGQSLAYIDVEMVDEEGRRVPFNDLPGEAEVTGNATLQAFGTGRPITDERYTSGRFTSYLGRWQAILRAGANPGEAALTVRAPGLEAATISIPVV